MNLQEDSKLIGEYDESFTGDEKLQHKIVGIKSNVKVTTDVMINIGDIVTSEFKTTSRVKTVTGLSSLINEWGVVSPIHVLKIEDDGVYLLLDGLRRIFASLRKGEKQIRAIVWEFDDVDEGKEIAPIISLMINRTQKYSNIECWNIMERLLERSASPGLIEFLLQLNGGDAMKLQDIMTVDLPAFDETREKFVADEINIDTAFKKLTAERKKEDRAEKDDRTVLKVNEDNGGVQTGTDENSHRLLDVDEVKDLLDMNTVTPDNVDEASVEELDRSAEVNRPEVQDKDNRHPVDPAIKQAVFRRDDFTCQCCGLKGEANIGVLVFHHIIGVACGGPDTEENGLTLCQNCHMLLHMYVFGKVRIKWDAFDESEEKKFKRICMYGNKQIDAWKRVGKSKSEAYKEDASSRRHLYPGEGLEDIERAYKGYTPKDSDDGGSDTSVAEASDVSDDTSEE